MNHTLCPQTTERPDGSIFLAKNIEQPPDALDSLINEFLSFSRDPHDLITEIVHLAKGYEIELLGKLTFRLLQNRGMPNETPDAIRTMSDDEFDTRLANTFEFYEAIETAKRTIRANLASVAMTDIAA